MVTSSLIPFINVATSIVKHCNEILHHKDSHVICNSHHDVDCNHIENIHRKHKRFTIETKVKKTIGKSKVNKYNFSMKIHKKF